MPAAAKVSLAVQYMHTAGPVRAMTAEEIRGIAPTEFGLAPPCVHRDAVRRAGARVAGALRGAQCRGPAAIHDARRTRRHVPDVALRRPAVGRGDRSRPGAMSTSATDRFVRRLAIAWVLLAAPLPWAGAHEGGTTAFARITLSGQTVRYILSIPDTASRPIAPALRDGRTGAGAHEALAAAVRGSLRLSGDATPCAAGPAQVVAGSGVSVSLTITIDFACPSTMRALAIRRRYLRCPRKRSAHPGPNRARRRHRTIRLRDREARGPRHRRRRP